MNGLFEKDLSATDQTGCVVMEVCLFVAAQAFKLGSDALCVEADQLQIGPTLVKYGALGANGTPDFEEGRGIREIQADEDFGSSSRACSAKRAARKR